MYFSAESSSFAPEKKKEDISITPHRHKNQTQTLQNRGTEAPMALTESFISAIMRPLALNA